jgi:hypothetical protein
MAIVEMRIELGIYVMGKQGSFFFVLLGTAFSVSLIQLHHMPLLTLQRSCIDVW